MTVLQAGSELKDIGFRLIADLGRGLLGRRFKAQPVAMAPDQPAYSRIAEVVSVSSPVVEALCDNISMLAGKTDISGIGNVIATHWSDDTTFVALMDIDAKAQNIPTLIHPDHFWNRAAEMFNAVKKLHSREIVHSAICRDVIYVHDDIRVLGDLWWAHQAEGKPLHESLSGHYLESLPRDAWAFAAPEVIGGEPPSRQSDVYSLGALWFYLLCGQLPRVVPEKGALSKIKKQLLAGEPPDLLKVHPEFDAEIAAFVRAMMMDSQHRMNIFQVEAGLLERASATVGNPIDDRKPFELTNELYVGISLVPPELAFILNDMYFAAGSVQVGIDRGGDQFWMTLEGLVTRSGGIYMALSYPGDMCERAEMDTMVAVKMEDNRIITLTVDEFDTVRYDLHISVQKRAGHVREYVESVLGKLRDWHD